MALIAFGVNAGVISNYYLVFTSTSPTTCKVKARSGSTLAGDLVIPEYNPNNANQRVTEIEYAGFLHKGTSSGNTNTIGITSVTIPAGVQTIGGFAFYKCAGIKQLDMSACEATDLEGKSIFRDCEALETVILPNKNLVKIADGMFYGCKQLKSINIPHSVSVIGRGAFAYCSELANVNSYNTNGQLLGNTINAQIIGCAAFTRCSVLESIHITDRTTEIRNDAFYDCPSLQQVSINAPVVAIGDNAFDKTAITTIDWGNTFLGAISVGYKGFPNNYIYNDPINGWSHADDYMQYLNSSLTIDYKKYGGNTLSGVIDVFEIPTTDFDLPNPNKRLAYCPTSLLENTNQNNYTLENGTSFIDAMAMNNTLFKTVSLNNDLVYIDAGAFANMTELRELTIPASVKRFAPSEYFLVLNWGNLADLNYNGSAIGSSMTGVCKNTPKMAYFDMSRLNKGSFSAHYNDDEFSVREGLFNGTTYRSNRIYVGQNCFSGMYEPTLIYLPVDTEDKWVDADFEVYGRNFIFTASSGAAYCHLYEAYDYFQNNGVGNESDNYRGGRNYYAIPHEFVAETAKYKRTFKAGGKYTVCLPFAVDAGQFGTFYELSGYDPLIGKVTFKAIATTATQPRTPYIFIPNADFDELVAVQTTVNSIPDGVIETGNFVEDEVIISINGEDVARFLGGYETHDFDSDWYTYGHDDSTPLITGADTPLYPFHAFFWGKNGVNEVVFESDGKPQITGMYKSQFDVNTLQNKYENSVRVVNTLDNSPILASQFEVGTTMTITRKDHKDSNAITIASILVTGKTASENGYTFSYDVNMANGAQGVSGMFTADATGNIDFNNLTVVDQFSASTANNDHSGGYQYQLAMKDALGNNLLTNVVDVPVYKTKHTTTAAGFIYNQVRADTEHQLDLTRPIPAAIRVTDDAEIERYELMRNKTALASQAVHNEDNTYTSYGNTADGWQMLTEKISFSNGETIKMIDSQDYANPSQTRIFYTPIITARTNDFNELPITNTYGGMEKEVETCKVEITTSDMEKTKVLAGPITIDGVGTLNSYMGYAATITLTAQFPIDDSNVYMYRLWRVHPDGSEVLLNKYQTTSANNNYPGHPWGSDYTALAKKDNQITVRDVFLYYPINQLDNNLCPVSYIARLYAQEPTPPASAPRGREIISRGYDIAENVITIEFSNDEIPTAVESTFTNKSVASVMYYNAAGMASTKPFKGLNVVITNYVDGTRQIVKVIK